MIITMLNNRGRSPAKSDCSKSSELAEHMFNETDLQALHHFQNVTARTLGTEQMGRMYERELHRLACHVIYSAPQPQIEF